MEEKSIFASKTFWGALIAGGSALLAVFGVDVSAGEQSALVGGLAAVGGVVGTVVAIWGRFKAEKKVKL